MFNNNVIYFLDKNQIEGLEVIYSQDSWLIHLKNWLGYHRNYGDEIPSDQDKIELMHELGILIADDMDVLTSWSGEIINYGIDVCWFHISSNSSSIITKVCSPDTAYLKISNIIIPKVNYLDFLDFIYSSYPFISIPSSKFSQIGIKNPLEIIISCLYEYNIDGISCTENDKGDSFCFLVIVKKDTDSAYTFYLPQENFSSDLQAGEVISLSKLDDLYFDSSFLSCIKDCLSGNISKYIDVY